MPQLVQFFPLVSRTPIFVLKPGKTTKQRPRLPPIVLQDTVTQVQGQGTLQVPQDTALDHISGLVRRKLGRD